MSTSLHSGNSISHYRVISPLGAGGMGEVYMARDETLERAVALKILPPELVTNESRVQRFIQEAKSASSLSHPHIVTIYEIGQARVHSGDDGDTTATASEPIHFIAMELITGETLKEKIHHDRPDLRKTLRYLAQAAEGLAKAHSAGIVHRDLKPENIMISKDGYAKVLDFGLAKLIERQDVSSDLSSTPTTTRATGAKTREGAVLGTVGYMSPEQVRGKVVDHRSDIFSFGCILYEAATGKRPFTADSDVETMHRILHDEPVPIEEMAPQAPAALRRLIRRCLAKTPDTRLQSMKDLALELDEIVNEYDRLSPASGSATSRSGASGASGQHVISGSGNALKTGRGRQIAIGSIAFVIVATLIGLVLKREPSSREPAGDTGKSAFQSMRMTRLTDSGNVRQSAISSEGRYSAHVLEEGGRFSLHVRQIATGSDVQIVAPLPTPFRGVTFSPDGNYVYYVNQETGGPGYSYLYQVPVLGGTARKLLFDIDTAPSFSPDGSRIAFLRGYPQIGEGALMIANADGSGERKLAVRKDPDGFSLNASPSWSPDGKRILATSTRTQGDPHSSILVVDAEDGTTTTLGPDNLMGITGVAWLPEGGSIALTTGLQRDPRGQVWLLPWPEGPAHRVTNDLNTYLGIGVTTSALTLITTQTNRLSELWLAPAGDAASQKKVPGRSSGEDQIRWLAATGSHTAVVEIPSGGQSQLWSIDTDTGARTALTSGDSQTFSPHASPSANMIVYANYVEGEPSHIWKMDLDGANPVQLTHGDGEINPVVSNDGRSLLYVSSTDEIWKLDLGGASQPVRFATGYFAMFSPDGSLVAVERFEQMGERAERRIRILPSTGGDDSKAPSIAYPEGDNRAWSPDGTGLTYQRDIGGITNLWFQPLDGGPARQLTDFDSGRIFDYVWMPDGKGLLLVRGEETSDAVLITDFR